MKLENTDFQKNAIGQSTTDQLKSIDYQSKTIRQTLSDEFKKALIQPEKLLANLSYSHFSELMTITDIHKRTFFEMETIKGRWNVQELRRQINTLYYERSRPPIITKVTICGLQLTKYEKDKFITLVNNDYRFMSEK